MDLQGRISELRELVSKCENANQLTLLIKSNPKIKDVISSLYFDIFNKQLSGCNNCIADGTFLILKHSNMNKSNFQLRAGEVIYDPSPLKDAAKMLTQNNMSEELAIYHIAENPKCFSKFTKFPANTQQLVDAYIAKKYADNEEAKNRARAIAKEVFGEAVMPDSMVILGLKEQVDALALENKTLSEEKESLAGNIDTLTKEKENLQSKFDNLTGEMLTLRSDFELVENDKKALEAQKKEWEEKEAELSGKISMLEATLSNAQTPTPEQTDSEPKATKKEPKQTVANKE